MDTNNFQGKIGVGEREGRVFSTLVKSKSLNLAHGIGRSGDIQGNQPKAAGSSLILQITKFLVRDTLKQLNYQFANEILVLPMATGAALGLIFLTLKKKILKNTVIFLRIDQKTCLKSIDFACCQPLVIEGVLNNTQIETNLDGIRQVLKENKDILCVVSTTSCFAPRMPDKVEEIAKLCKEFGCSHIINNAYGVFNSKITNQINLAMKFGTVSAVVQSTDKNFLVPVGGSIVFSQSEELINEIQSLYPGRASISPILDVFITLLELGKVGIKRLAEQRKDNFKYFLERIQLFCEQNGEKVLANNNYSIAISVQRFKDIKDKEFLGSQLFLKRIMGCRVIQESCPKQLCKCLFNNYGSHIQNYCSLPYLTVACAVGMERQEIDVFLEKLQQLYKTYK